jgi:hypothetical protein
LFFQLTINSIDSRRIRWEPAKDYHYVVPSGDRGNWQNCLFIFVFYLDLPNAKSTGE